VAVEIDTMFGMIREKWERVTANPELQDAEQKHLMAMVLATTMADILGWNVFVKVDPEDTDKVVVLGTVNPNHDLSE
jgi:hypothetical protein